MSAPSGSWLAAQGNDFFNSLNRTKHYNVLLTAETEDFDPDTEKQWREEGFITKYVPLLNGGPEYIRRVHAAGDSFGTGEYYAIVAFGEAASLILQGHMKPNHPKLVAIICYYPSIIPSVHTKYPPGIRVLVHLAGTEVGVQHHPEVLGIQGKQKTTKKRLDPGAGYGEPLNIAWPAYTYAGVRCSFAERDLEEFDPVAESVAFTRSLNAVRRAFRIEPDFENIRDDLVDWQASGQVEKALGRIRDYAQVINGPTLTGGIGQKELRQFYTSFFHPLPKDFRTRLLSRTIDTARCVDEIFVSFTHTQPIEWILPGVPATNKKVEVVVISIVRMTSQQKLESEHMYWDQASVLMQVGLLSPKMVPESFRKKGVEELPIWGAESARAMKRGSSTHMNELIIDWQD